MCPLPGDEGAAELSHPGPGSCCSGHSVRMRRWVQPLYTPHLRLKGAPPRGGRKGLGGSVSVLVTQGLLGHSSWPAHEDKYWHSLCTTGLGSATGDLAGGERGPRSVQHCIILYVGLARMDFDIWRRFFRLCFLHLCTRVSIYTHLYPLDASMRSYRSFRKISFSLCQKWCKVTTH